MRSLLLTAYCISLLSFLRLETLPAEELPDENRLDDIIDQRRDKSSVSRSQKNIDVPPLASSLSPKWLSKHSGSHSRVKVVLRSLAWARPQRLFRARRHIHSRGMRGHHYPHPNQLIRAGCALGTCQVQNLSHRLYQLIGQSGRDDSSPINPKSPHSYG
ncbi:protein ADM2a [Takifugu flavidus]|uniref:ADM2 Intermedin n=1 Tax=Takifugu flavidus TaxID=433684 RepID=A0A5C6NDL3_9TELE|nr:protein ADM2a [Takifugu flavidus]TWW65018.1 ADM2 Intermedin [Takifugu flavidus]